MSPNELHQDAPTDGVFTTEVAHASHAITVPSKPLHFDISRDMARHVEAQRRNPVSNHGWPVRSLKDAFDPSSKKPSWVIKDLLLAESGAIVSAHPHAMKSLSWLAACMQAPATGKVWGHFDAPDADRTLFVETEDPEWLVEARIRGLAQGLGLSGEPDSLPGFHYACVGPFDLLSADDEIARLLETYRPKFMVLSTLQNLLKDKSWNSQEDMQPIMARLIHLSRQCPVVLITHSPKDRRQKGAAGTITQAANFATLLHYEKDGSKVNITVDSKAGGQESAFCVSLETEGDKSDPESVRTISYNGKVVNSKRKELLGLLAEKPTATARELAQLADCSERYAGIIRKEYEAQAPRARRKS